MSEYTKIGKVKGTHGLKGMLIIEHDIDAPVQWQELSALLLETSPDSYIPYFIQTIHIRDRHLLSVKLEDIRSKEEAGRFSGISVFVDQQRLSEIMADQTPLILIGFSVKNDQNQELGKIVEIQDLPGQKIVTIQNEGREILVSLNEETLQSIDSERKIIYIHPPEGLVDIYLE